MQCAGYGQGEGGNACVEMTAVVGEHAIAPLHRADRGLEDRPAGVAKALPGLEVGLLADHALATDFADLAVGVGNEPAPRQQR